jgi:hypothetical protein
MMSSAACKLSRMPANLDRLAASVALGAAKPHNRKTSAEAIETVEFRTAIPHSHDKSAELIES